MARKKVKLAWITNDAARRATFKKRKRGLLKKVSELSTLCGVEASTVVVSPYEADPDVWPSVQEAERVLLKFKTIPPMDQGKKMLNQEGFFRQRIEKLKHQAKKLSQERREKEMDLLLFQCLAGRSSLEGLWLGDLNELVKKVDSKKKGLQERIDVMMGGLGGGLGGLGGWVPPRHEESVRMLAGGPGTEKTALETAMEALQRQQWFMEVMNPLEQMGMYGGDEMVLPYADTHSWFDAFP